MAHRYPLIFNPNAKSQRGRKTLRFLMSHAQWFGLYASRSAEDATELARMFADRGEPVVLVAGGDGTVNSVVQGLLGSSTALGVVPTGTMNVFARELGMPINSLKKSLEVIEEGFIKDVDIFTANGHPFVQMAGIGFDAQVIEETTWETKKLLGPLAYLVAAIKVFGDTPPKMKVTSADGTVEEGVCAIAGNGSLYGGQMKLFRKADHCDEVLDVLLFTDLDYKLVRDSVMGMAKGAIDLGNASVKYLQSESFTIECDREVPMEVDGEYVGRVTEVALSPAMTKLKVVAPKAPHDNMFISIAKSIAGGIPRKTPASNTMPK